MHNNTEFDNNIENSTLIPEAELKPVEKGRRFSYKQGICELNYTHVSYHPVISFPLIKLSKYSTKSALMHREVLKDINEYLQNTK